MAGCPRSFLRRLTGVCFMVTLSIVSASGQAQPLSHPNHYILLVDASFSTVENKIKNRAYHQLLHEELPRLLYSTGFNEIPRIMPAEDQVSLLNFGIVTDNYTAKEAYSVLSRFSFQTQFIHPVFVRRTGVAQEVLDHDLTPRQFYRLTVSSWGPQLAVRFLRESALGSAAERTFLILITDGELNGNSSREEIANARRKGAPDDIEAVRIFLQDFTHIYTYPGREVGGASFAAKYDAGSGRQNPNCGENCFYLEAYEIIPAKWLEWQRRAVGIAPFGSSGVSYEQRGTQTAVAIRVEQSRALRGWLEEAPNVEQRESQWTVIGDTKSTLLGPQMSELHVALPAPLACAPRTFPLSAQGTVRQHDPLLGTRTTQFTFSQSTAPEEPAWCKTAHFVKIAALLAIAIVLATMAGWYGYNRFWVDHIRIILPGLLGTLTLKRKGTHNIRLLVPPHLKVPAVEVQLPVRWRQTLFYSGARLKISGEMAGALRWSHNEDLEFSLPWRTQSNDQRFIENVTAVWRHLPSGQAALLLQIEEGRRTGTLNISFSQSWNSSYGAAHE